jgi:redox-sensing transcriptional repressor
MPMRKIADSTVRRLSLYLRLLEEFHATGVATVSSGILADRGATTAAQVRKDLSCFGSFGKRGMGYRVPALLSVLRDILGLEREYAVVVIGAGRVGSALAQFQELASRGFHVAGVYDRDPAKIGRGWEGVTVRDVAQLEADLAARRADIAIVAVPPESAQGVTDRLVAAGVTAILNFAPVPLAVPPDVTVNHVNMALELETLSYALRHH